MAPGLLPPEVHPGPVTPAECSKWLSTMYHGCKSQGGLLRYSADMEQYEKDAAQKCGGCNMYKKEMEWLCGGKFPASCDSGILSPRNLCQAAHRKYQQAGCEQQRGPSR